MYKARFDENGCAHVPSPSEFLDILGLKGTIDGGDFARMTEAASEVSEDEKRFSDLLRQTNRQFVDELLKWLKKMGFFTAPASVNYHGAFKGGLVKHSLNVYDAAMRIREEMIASDPSIANELEEENVAVAALLHDVCKMDEYEIDADGKPHHKRNVFPIGGHGEKSIIYIQKYRFMLYPIEMLAIRWHMGKHSLNSKSDEKYYRAAMEFPLCRLIANADYQVTH